MLVTGATGAVGSSLPGELLERGMRVRLFVRKPARAVALYGDQAELAIGDFSDTAAIRDALVGVDRVFLCSGNHPWQVEHETSVIDAAADAGVQLLVKVGANGAEIGSPVAFWDANGRIAAHLKRAELRWVLLHPSSYMSNLLGAAETIRRTGQLFAPAGEAKVALIDPRDVAAVAAVALTEDGHHGRTYTLTGPEATTYRDVARQLSAATGQPVEYVDVAEADARTGMIWRQLRRGSAAATTDVVRVLTGREPRTVAEFGRDFAGAFRSGAVTHHSPQLA